MEAELAQSRRSGRPTGMAGEAQDPHSLTTVSRLFIESGYAGTSIEQIADDAGAGKPPIYRRYASRGICSTWR
jgi:AcrR family transcriptional regulator